MWRPRLRGVLAACAAVLCTASAMSATPAGAAAASADSGLAGLASAPTVTFTSPEPQSLHTGKVRVTAEASPSAEPGAPAVAHVEFFQFRGQQPAVDTEPPYTHDWDVSAPGDRTRLLFAVAVDADGNRSRETALPVMVSGPPRAVLEEPFTAVVARDRPLWWNAAVDFPGTRSPWRTWIEKVELAVDGTVVETRTGPWCFPSSACDAAGHIGELFGAFRHGATAGRHTFTLRVTDNLGAVGVHSRDLVLDGGVRVSVPTLDGRALASGARLSTLVSHDFAVAVAPVTKGAAISQATLELDGHIVDQFSCATESARCPTSGIRLAGSAGLERSATGARELTLTVEMTSGGAPYVTRWPLRVHPTAALTRTVSARVVRPGQKVTVAGVLRRSDTNAPVAGRPVSIQWAADGTERWRTVATRTTGARGAFSARLVPSQRGRYRVVHAERAGVLGPGTSAPVSVSVAPLVTAKLADASVRRNEATALSISVRPVVGDTTVWVQRQLASGRWRNDTSVRLSSKGRATTLVSYRGGTHRLRVALPRTARYAPAVSSPVRLRVR